MRLAQPEYFILFIFIAALFVWMWKMKQKHYPSLQMSQTSWFKYVGTSGKVKFKNLPEFFKYGALAFIVFALIRPQEVNTKIKRTLDGIDIMIVFDISDSMLIEDMQPTNRIESAKKIIKAFIQKRISDRIGLVVFSGESYTRVPPTLDYPLLLKNLEGVETMRQIKMGTAIGVALANAVARLRDSTAKSKVVVLLTDGENNSGLIDPETTALEIAKNFGVRIYTIGIGKNGDSQLPIYIQGHNGATIKRYQPIHSTINEDLLKKMAKESGGQYYRAENTPTLEKVFISIDRLEKSKVDITQYNRYGELFQHFILAAFLFLFLGTLLEKTWLRRQP